MLIAPAVADHRTAMSPSLSRRSAAPRVTFEVDLSVGAEIAQTLFISVRTAETHRAHILKKLHLTTRAELDHYALQYGLLTDDGAAA